MNIEPGEPKPEVELCPNCHAANLHDDQFCGSCGFPLKGTEEEKTNFKHQVSFKHIQLHDNKKIIRRATNSLFVVGGVFAIYGIVYFFMSKDKHVIFEFLVTYFIVSIIFFLLGLWSTSKPVAAIVSGLVLFTAWQLLLIINEPGTIFRGLILKIFVFVYLIRGLQSAIEAQKLSKDLKVK